MFSRIRNSFLEKIITKRSALVRSFLEKDLNERSAILNKIHSGEDRATSLMYGGDVTRVTADIEEIRRRLQVEEQYVELQNHYKDDSTRKYSINVDFNNYLRAIQYLYTHSGTAVAKMTTTKHNDTHSRSMSNVVNALAPGDVYRTINTVKERFDALAKSIKP